VEVHRAGPFVSAFSAIARVLYFTKVSDPGYSEIDEDYALIITADRIGDRFGYFGFRTYNSSWDDEPFCWNIGYSEDIRGMMYPHYQKGKSLDEDEWDYGSARSMTTSADLTHGQSGSPIFGFWLQDGVCMPYVVAVVSSQGSAFFSGDENWCSGGSLLSRLIRYGRDVDSP
jgi:hypothetical protein